MEHDFYAHFECRMDFDIYLVGNYYRLSQPNPDSHSAMRVRIRLGQSVYGLVDVQKFLKKTVRLLLETRNLE